MMKVVYSEMDTPAGISCRLEAAGHAGYAPAGQDIVCAGASTVMQGLVCLLAGEESARSDAFDEPDGPRLAVQADAPCAEWVQGAFELAKACFALLAERYPENVRFADVSRRGEKSMMDLQLFAAAEATAACGGNREPRLGQRPAEHECRSRHEVGAGSRNPWETFMLQLFAEGDAAPAPPALSEAQTRQAVASGTMKPGEAAPAVSAAPQPEPEARPEPPVQRPELPPLSGLACSTRTAVQGLHARWAAEEAAIRRSQPDFNLPHNLFLHSEIIQSRKWNLKEEAVIQRQLKFEFKDTLFSMIIGWAINSAMILMAAATFYQRGENQVDDLTTAGNMLTPLLGNEATVIFAIALLLAGLSSSITAGMAGGTIFSGIFNKPYDIATKETRQGVLITMIPAALIILLIRSPFQGLIYSQMLLAVQLPITIFTQIYLTSSKKVMGKYANSTGLKMVLWAIAIVVTALNIGLFVTGF